MSEKTVGIGIIGAGFLAETRARCYARIAGGGARIVAVSARTKDSATKYAARHRIAHAFADVDALLALPEVEVVDLCVPNLLHRPMAERAARAGKHVICTKPLTAYVGQDLGDNPTDEEVSSKNRRHMLEIAVRDAEAMVATCREHGVRLMYGENWIYAPSIVRARGLLATGGTSIVEMRGHEAHNGSHSPYSKVWRFTGGGALLRLGAHPIGAMLHLKAVEGIARNQTPIRPISVTAEVADLSTVPGVVEHGHLVSGWKDVENWGTAIITFEDGSRGVAHGSDNLLGGMESKLEILGSNTHLKCNLSPHDELRAYAPTEGTFGDAYIMEKVSGQSGWSTPIPSEDYSSGQLPMCEEFVAAVREDRDALSDGSLGRDVTEVLYAAYVSASEGRRVSL